VYYGDDNKCRELKTNAKPVGNIECPVKYITQALRNNRDIEAIVYSGHSGGPYLGGEGNPMINIDEVSKILKEELTHELSFIYFDSCNMGFLRALVSLAGTAKYVVGCPNYCDWVSILQTSEIYHLGKGDISELKTLLDNHVGKYDGREDVLVELCVYEPKKLIKLWDLYKQHEDNMIFPKEAVIEEDYYDLLKLIDYNRGVLPGDVTKELEETFAKGVIKRARCEQCALDVPPAYLAVRPGNNMAF
jgi:hypothetical protein